MFVTHQAQSGRNHYQLMQLRLHLRRLHQLHLLSLLRQLRQLSLWHPLGLLRL
jgi:hypothetical protein